MEPHKITKNCCGESTGPTQAVKIRFWVQVVERRDLAYTIVFRKTKLVVDECKMFL